MSLLWPVLLLANAAIVLARCVPSSLSRSLYPAFSFSRVRFSISYFPLSSLFTKTADSDHVLGSACFALACRWKQCSCCAMRLACRAAGVSCIWRGQPSFQTLPVSVSVSEADISTTIAAFFGWFFILQLHALINVVCSFWLVP